MTEDRTPEAVDFSPPRVERGSPPVAPRGRAGSRFSTAVMHQAATMYYLRQATQAEIAAELGMSRPTVSRVLSEALRLGIVTIEVAPLPQADSGETADLLRSQLGLEHVFLAEDVPATMLGPSLAPAVGQALRKVGMRPGSVILLATGRTVYHTVQAELPALPGVVVAPAVGGQDDPEPWYQANEITRQFAAQVGGHPVFLYAPALPGAALRDTLVDDDNFAQVFDVWSRARCALVGIGAPPRIRDSIAVGIPADADALDAAVGDVCLRFFDINGTPVEFPGSERLIAVTPEALRRIPSTIAVAVGEEKVPGIIGAARGGYIKELVTDMRTALQVLETLQEPNSGRLDGTRGDRPPA